MDVSIIIVNYNTSKLINDCINTIFCKTLDVDYEIIIVDNNSEKLEDVIIEAKDSRIRLLQLSENIGFGGANNAGVEIARGRNLFFLNPDTLLINNAIKILSDFLDNNPKCGVCGGNLFNKDMHPVCSFHRKMPGIFWEIDDLFHTIPEKILYGKNRYFNYSGKPIRVGYIQGADLMITTSLFKKLGGFSDDFFMYYEETDLCRRVKKAGYAIISEPKAEIIHYESASFDNSEAVKRKWKIVYESRKIYLIKGHSYIKYKLSNFLCYLFLRSRILLLKNSPKKEIYKVRLNSLMTVDTK
ncbi:MAG: glycosyltransferase family 2 protein [Muribaculum sp.]|nr:glycosyltransferase family 2 protein [Muribaculum sp.]